MARPTRYRKIGHLPLYRSFSSDDIVSKDSILMTVDEFEVLRLLDNEGLTQEVCAIRMNISRTTVTAIYSSARKKVADMLVNGKNLLISGGYCEFEPIKINQNIMKKGSRVMRLAVTYEEGKVFQHFGKSKYFKIYDIENGQITGEQIIDTNGNGHGALAGFLKSANVDELICGGIGVGAQTALNDASIKFYAGVEGIADEAARALAQGKLEYDPDASCNDHEHKHKAHGHHYDEKHSCN